MPEDSISQLSQEQLIQGIKENQRDVMSGLYLEVFPKVRSYILQNSGDEDQAKDIFQEAFLVAWQKVKNGDFQPQNATAMQGFLFQVSKNKWLDWLRSSRYKMESSMGAISIEVADSEDEILLDERLGYLEKAFQHLGESCRELLKRFYYEKVSLEDLAVKFGWTPQTAKNNKYRCMEKLRKLIKR
ncbi:sigma-70 family RNA polymerase sigma factor [Algoriphagus halophytocola]|uniref:Sigma-70 family RNA polymerase sigma factor n=1 Tax=Algoriphagus halophytocola TaxID=2991499 RepID=A0ABY6MKR3_9BACT|nr:MULTISPECIES: sigma-70 family RNA polymerase sigma factor [unclassified Algoriphagus]UZD22871.1 sigma-70 family RNA polymerase sigma factor [Algoriphagus sp. TR-M5]WBL44138.1 sigma-70 family RNA polymerase sigma factor [Algoriphagus sp. TR-M9]